MKRKLERINEAFGLDFAGYSTGKSALAFAKRDAGIISVSLIGDHALRNKRKGKASFKEASESDFNAVRAMIARAPLFVDIPIDLQGLERPGDVETIWELYQRPIDRALGALAPLTSRLGRPTLRFQKIWDELGQNRNRVYETYPARVVDLIRHRPGEESIKGSYKGEWVEYSAGRWKHFKGKKGALAELLNRSGIKAHKGIVVSDDDFDAIICALVGVLPAKASGERDINQLLGQLGTARRVKSPPVNFVLLSSFNGSSVEIESTDRSLGDLLDG